MAELIEIQTFKDKRGCLSVIDKLLDFEIKRVYYIYQAAGERGGHRHKKTKQFLVAVHGSCDVYVHNGVSEFTYKLNNPNQGLILETSDWHTMSNFSKDCVLLVLASEHYDVKDYIDEKY
jgi:hypothetical protein